MSHIAEETSVTNSSIPPSSTVPPPDDIDTSCRICDKNGIQLKIFIGSVLMLFVATSWIASTHLAQDTYKFDGFHAPFFVMYILTATLILFYPCYILLAYICSKGMYSPREEFSEHVKLFNPVEFCLGQSLWKSALLSLLWSVTNYTYIRALDPHLLDATDVVTLFATNHSFTFLLSWIVLFEKFVAVRICAMICSLTGIILFAYADGFAQPSMWGVFLAVVSSSTTAITKVLYKKFLVIPSSGQLSLLMSIIGFANTITLWPVLLTLSLTGVEQLSATSIPWHYVGGVTMLIIVLQVVLNYAEKYTYPMFIGLGFAFGIPLCAVSDYMWKNRQFHGMKLAAVVLTFCGLIMVLLPDKCPDGVCLSCHCRKPYVESPTNRTRHRLRKISRM